jgi:hypothetical protein
MMAFVALALYLQQSPVALYGSCYCMSLEYLVRCRLLKPGQRVTDILNMSR